MTYGRRGLQAERDNPSSEGRSLKSSEYYVPPDLRPFYAHPDAEPSDAERAGYVKNGVSITETGTREITQVVSAGTAEKAPVVERETVPVNNLVDIGGASGYPTWLHLKWLDKAQHAKRRDEFMKVMDSQHGTCEVCAGSATAE